MPEGIENVLFVYEGDKGNLIGFDLALKRELRERGFEGKLKMVGGILTKPQPRKDIDILFILKDSVGLPRRKNYEDEYSYAMADFEIMKDLIKSVVKHLEGVKIKNIRPPTIDKDLEDPNILEHEGSVTINPGKGTPIELIRSRNRY